MTISGQRCCVSTATASSRCRRSAGATPTAPCTAVAPRRRNLSCGRSHASMSCRRCRYDRSPFSAKRSCGPSTWSATTTSAISPLPGAQLRYLVTSQRRVLAVVGFGASAWKAAPRDRFIDWSDAQRELPAWTMVMRNVRLLDLALGAGAQSRFHGAGSQQLRCCAIDWQARDGNQDRILIKDLQAVRPVPRDLLPHVADRIHVWSDPRPRHTRRASLRWRWNLKDIWMLNLLQARLPPPTLSGAAILTPTSRTLFVSDGYEQFVGW